MPVRRPDNTTIHRHATLIARALAYVETHLDEALDADTLADRAAMSRHHFHRVFLAQVGCSVGTHVTRRRMQRACALLVSGSETVLEIALAVGFESAQALAKAMRRALGCTPGDVRHGRSHAWTTLWMPDRPGTFPPPPENIPMLQPDRFAELDPSRPLTALTATARGMVANTLTRAAQQAFGELMTAIGRAGQMPAIRSCIALAPDDAKGPDDPGCRYIAGVLFGHRIATGEGDCQQPAIPLGGSLAWTPLAPGRYAVFTHIGPYDTLHRSWNAIYGDWLPASGQQLRDVPPLEVCITMPDTTPPDRLHTEIWIPVA